MATALGPGILRIEARIRRVGEQECISRMSYPIILEEIQPPPGIVATDPAQPLPGD